MSNDSNLRIQVRLTRANFSLNLDLDLPGNGITALFGVSGSGKTTALRVLAGLEPHAQGRICVQGMVWQDSAIGLFKPVHQRALGYVFQEPSLFDHLDVQGNLQYGFKRTPRSERRQNWNETLELLGISHLLHRLPSELSGGERQRVAIARALATSPRLLLLDEPLAALDAHRKSEILPFLEQLQKTLSIPVILVTHAVDEVARLADRMAFISNGQAQHVESLQDALARPDSPLFDERGPVSVLQGTLCTEDSDGLRLFGNDRLQLRLSLPKGASASATRLRVLARDVSLATVQPQGLSILNQLPTTIAALYPDASGRVTVVCRLADGQPLLSEITRYSCQTLALTPGMSVFALIKSVALMD